MRRLPLIILMLLALSACGETPAPSPSPPPDVMVYRCFNTDTYTVEDFQGQVWTTANGQILCDDEVVVKSGVKKPSTISIIGDYVYFMADEGLMRFDMYIRELEPLYYDVSLWSCAGYNAMYYISGNLELRSIFSDSSSLTIAKVSEDATFALSGQYLYVKAFRIDYADSIITELVIDLETDTIV